PDLLDDEDKPANEEKEDDDAFEDADEFHDAEETRPVPTISLPPPEERTILKRRNSVKNGVAVDANGSPMKVSPARKQEPPPTGLGLRSLLKLGKQVKEKERGEKERRERRRLEREG